MKHHLLLISILSMFLSTIAIPSYGGQPNFYAAGIQAENAGNYVEAISQYEIAAKSGLKDAKYALGRIYRDVYGDMDNSFKWFLEAAKQGDAFAQYEVGMLYRYGNAVVPQDLEQAKQWLTLATKRRRSKAAYALFEMADSDDEALMWLQQAAKWGVTDAMEKLGHAYKNGMYGLEINLSLSQHWLEQATQAKENNL